MCGINIGYATSEFFRSCTSRQEFNMSSSSFICVACLSLIIVVGACDKGNSNDVNPFASQPSSTFQIPDYDEGDATFSASGTNITISGLITSSSPDSFNALLALNSGINTIILQNVGGTKDADASFAIGRTIRSNAFSTTIPAGGLVASGGTDIFLSGTIRTLESGGYIGVHSWESGLYVGSELPTTSDLHQPFITYYAEMGISSDFYWFAVNAAAPDSVHWMTNAQINQYGMTKAN